MSTALVPTSLARRLTGAAAALLLALGALTLPSSPASAAERDGVCDVGEVCFHYNSDQKGAVSDFTGSMRNYGSSQPGCYEFKSPDKDAAGRGECMKNNTASVTNRTAHPVTVYYNSNYGGRSQVIPAGASANLDPALKNNNASHHVDAPSCHDGVCAV
ncbi:peptidase inhibitor family I36 protein [Actinomyces bowdenii]|uniref:Peptidase M23 n=1 Tax=Actinomyces bowdenii TaxID=131109 RepID=A0A3P1VA85_9ACTO|nr:peptidase inhibitor family I36 protein [Actinomyces bowdenii]MBO3724854.1 peptidase inhibitor family I36 protein [Actinomyces bowdenii]RRD30668.1 hypothetical protein EII10_00675 [Actinomyces bowdenii]